MNLKYVNKSNISNAKLNKKIVSKLDMSAIKFVLYLRSPPSPLIISVLRKPLEHVELKG